MVVIVLLRIKRGAGQWKTPSPENLIQPLVDAVGFQSNQVNMYKRAQSAHTVVTCHAVTPTNPRMPFQMLAGSAQSASALHSPLCNAVHLGCNTWCRCCESGCTHIHAYTHIHPSTHTHTQHTDIEICKAQESIRLRLLRLHVKKIERGEVGKNSWTRNSLEEICLHIIPVWRLVSTVLHSLLQVLVSAKRGTVLG